MNDEIQAKNRIGWIDIAKAIGIIFVLINHAELQLGFVTFLGGMFYMPVFFVLSGYTYKDNCDESMKTFIVNKAKRLLIPYACFQLILVGMITIKSIIAKQSIAQILFPLLGAFYSRNALYANATDTFAKVPNNNINLMTSFPAPLWFLTGLFITLIIYKLIMTLAKGNEKRGLLYVGISILIGIILKYLCPILLPWSIDTALISVGFIHIGKIMKKENLVYRLYKKPFYILAVFLVFITTSYINGSGNMSIRNFGNSVLLYIFVGGTGSVLVMLISKFIEEHSKRAKGTLEMIGIHTIGILALHLVIYAVIVNAFSIIDISGGMLEKVAKIIASVVILVPTDWFIQEYLPFVYGKKRRKNEK